MKVLKEEDIVFCFLRLRLIHREYELETMLQVDHEVGYGRLDFEVRDAYCQMGH